MGLALLLGFSAVNGSLSLLTLFPTIKVHISDGRCSTKRRIAVASV